MTIDAPTDAPERLTKSFREKTRRSLEKTKNYVLRHIPFDKERQHDIATISKLDLALAAEEENTKSRHKENTASVIPTIRTDLATALDNVDQDYKKLTLQALACRTATIIIASAINFFGPVSPNLLPGPSNELIPNQEPAYWTAILTAVIFVQFEKRFIQRSAKNITKEISILSAKISQEIIPLDRVDPKQAREEWEGMTHKPDKIL